MCIYMYSQVTTVQPASPLLRILSTYIRTYMQVVYICKKSCEEGGTHCYREHIEMHTQQLQCYLSLFGYNWLQNFVTIGPHLCMHYIDSKGYNLKQKGSRNYLPNHTRSKSCHQLLWPQVCMDTHTNAHMNIHTNTYVCKHTDFCGKVISKKRLA